MKQHPEPDWHDWLTFTNDECAASQRKWSLREYARMRAAKKGSKKKVAQEPEEPYQKCEVGAVVPKELFDWSWVEEARAYARELRKWRISK